MASRWSSASEEALLAAGWYAGRWESKLVDRWKEALRRSESRLEMSGAAERVLAEFGGLAIAREGAGCELARGAVVFDPILAIGEEDRFAAASRAAGSPLFPLGEAHGGHSFLGIDAQGAVYLVADDLFSVGADVHEALATILEGRRVHGLGPLRWTAPSTGRSE